MTGYPGWEKVKPKANKYGAERVHVEGIYFDSKAEAARFTELRLMQGAGLIDKLETHPLYKIEYNDRTICMVELDFKYFDRRRGEYVYEDVKSRPTNTSVSALKRKLVQAFHGIKVELIGI